MAVYKINENKRRRVKESNSRETSNALQSVIEGAATTLSEIDHICRRSSNNEINIDKKDLERLISQLRGSVRSMSEIVKGYSSKTIKKTDPIKSYKPSTPNPRLKGQDYGESD